MNALAVYVFWFDERMNWTMISVAGPEKLWLRILMDNAAQLKARPAVVTVALVLLMVTTIPTIVFNLIYNPWSSSTNDIQFGLFLVAYVLPLWLVFRRRNWARWLVAILAIIGLVGSIVAWTRYHETFSGGFALWFWLRDLMDLAAVIALFEPASNKWFRTEKDPLEPPPVAP